MENLIRLLLEDVDRSNTNCDAIVVAVVAFWVKFDILCDEKAEKCNNLVHASARLECRCSYSTRARC